MIGARWQGTVAVIVVLVMVGCQRPTEPPVVDAAVPPISSKVADPLQVTGLPDPPLEAINLDEVSALPETDKSPEPEVAPPDTVEEVTPFLEASAPISRGTVEPFARCQSCHSVQPGGEHGVGPNLFGIVGQRVGSRPGYTYSSAMASFDQTWTPQLLATFLENPRETIPGTKMMAGPVRDSEVRQAIIAYLAQQ